MRSLSLLVVVAAGCGRIGFDVGGVGAPDGGADGSTVGDAPVLVTGPFDTRIRVPELSVAGFADEDPTLTEDQLEIYFCSDRAGVDDIYRSTRSSPTGTWSVPQIVAELSSPALETGPHVSRDGLTIYFGSQRAGTLGQYDVYTSQRATRATPWSVPVHVVELSSTAYDAAPSATDDGLEIAITTERASAYRETFHAERATTTAPWSTPQVIAEIASDVPGHVTDGHLSGDGLRIVYSSARSGGKGALDLWMAARSSRTDPFGPEIPMEGANTGAHERDPWLSPDQHTLYFSSLTTGDFDIYVSTR